MIEVLEDKNTTLTANSLKSSYKAELTAYLITEVVLGKSEGGKYTYSKNSLVFLEYALSPGTSLTISTHGLEVNSVESVSDLIL
jgi:hypothetical protein